MCLAEHKPKKHTTVTRKKESTVSVLIIPDSVMMNQETEFLEGEAYVYQCMYMSMNKLVHKLVSKKSSTTTHNHQ